MDSEILSRRIFYDVYDADSRPLDQGLGWGNGSGLDWCLNMWRIWMDLVITHRISGLDEKVAEALTSGRNGSLPLIACNFCI